LVVLLLICAYYFYDYNRNYVEKGNLDGNERNYTQLTYKQTKWREVIKENTGSDKGKLVPTDIGTIVTDFLVKNLEIY
jgi:DNA topoisomerase-1